MKPHLTTRAAISALALSTWLVLPQAGQCFYNASSGRWISRDPVAEQSPDPSLHRQNRTPRQTLNQYAFNCEDPLSHVDMLGLYEVYSEGFAFRDPPFPASIGWRSGSGYQNSASANYDGWGSPWRTSICNSGVLRMTPDGDYPPERTSFVKAYLMNQCPKKLRISCTATLTAAVWGRLYKGQPAYNAVGNILGEEITAKETTSYPLDADGSSYEVFFTKTVTKDVTLPKNWTYVLYHVYMPIDAQVKPHFNGGFTEHGDANCNIQPIENN